MSNNTENCLWFCLIVLLFMTTLSIHQNTIITKNQKVIQQQIIESLKGDKR